MNIHRFSLVNIEVQFSIKVYSLVDIEVYFSRY